MPSPQRDMFTGNGIQTVFPLTLPPYAPSLLVFDNGLLQDLTNYSVSGQNLVFVTPPLSGDTVIAYYYTTATPSPPGAIDLTTIAAARAYGNVPAAVADALVQSLITSWSRAFMSMTRRGLDLVGPQTITEVHDGTGTDSMMLDNYPVIAITGPLVSMNFTIPVATPGGQDFGYLIGLTDGLIKLRGFRFHRGRGTVTVSYSYGFTSVPEDVGQAANEMVLWLLRARDHIDLDTNTLVGSQIVRYKTKFPLEVCTVIDRYSKRRRPSW